MQAETATWALVLAAGEGTRLRRLTTTSSGATIPKQFCSLSGRSSLLQEAVERAGAVASSRHTCVVVARQHRRWWASQLHSSPAENCIEEPEHRGTAIGTLLALLRILERDSAAQVVLLPSDQHVREESILKTIDFSRDILPDQQDSLRVHPLRTTVHFLVLNDAEESSCGGDTALVARQIAAGSARGAERHAERPQPI